MFLMSALSQYCESDGKIYNVGDEWKPNQFSVCKCAGPSAIQCSIIMVCLDHQQNQRQPGDRWLANPTNLCTCTDGNFVICQILKEPVCMDISGSLHQYGETWMNSSCVYCSCNNSGINCSGYNVNITHGLYSVKLFPTCEKCDIPSNALGYLNTCKGKQSFLFQFFIRHLRKLITCLNGHCPVLRCASLLCRILRLISART